MAEAKLKEIGEAVYGRWPGVRQVVILHRIGRLSVGEASVAIGVSAAHRQDAFEACQYAIDTVKRIVPIWKRELFEDGSAWVGLQGESPPPGWKRRRWPMTEKRQARQRRSCSPRCGRGRPPRPSRARRPRPRRRLGRPRLGRPPSRARPPPLRVRASAHRLPRPPRAPAGSGPGRRLRRGARRPPGVSRHASSAWSVPQRRRTVPRGSRADGSSRGADPGRADDRGEPDRARPHRGRPGRDRPHAGPPGRRAAGPRGHPGAPGPDRPAAPRRRPARGPGPPRRRTGSSPSRTRRTAIRSSSGTGVRHELLPLLTAQAGPRVADALRRVARASREAVEALDALVRPRLAGHLTRTPVGWRLALAALRRPARRRGEGGVAPGPRGGRGGGPPRERPARGASRRAGRARGRASRGARAPAAPASSSSAVAMRSWLLRPDGSPRAGGAAGPGAGPGGGHGRRDGRDRSAPARSGRGIRPGRPGSTPKRSASSRAAEGSPGRPLLVRPRRSGERMVPFGGGEPVRLTKLLAGAGVPRHARARWPVVAREGEVLWLMGVRRGAAAPLTAATRVVLRAPRRAGAAPWPSGR